jgi:ribonuclease HI
MRSGITQTNGNERRKDDEDRIKNIDERKPTYQITNDKPENLRRLCNETRINKQNPFSYERQNFSDKWTSMEEKWIRLSVKWEKEHQTKYSAPNSKKWSKKEDKVGYAVATDQQSTQRRIRDQSSVFRQEAIIDAIPEATDNGGQKSDIYWLTKHQDGPIWKQSYEKSEGQKDEANHGYTKGNVTLCCVPGHAQITGNEKADEEAKRALEESISNNEKYPPEDLSGWIKTEIASSRQIRWEEGVNIMKERKKNKMILRSWKFASRWR